ncbi:MAG: PDZ domain-containing protein [Flavobacteriales bacterium]|nr:PDZ domain-containing protein [Flavobacteriales bacterium]
MKQRAHIPLLLAVSMAIGLWLGSGLRNPFLRTEQTAGWQKIEQILQYVENDYVDTISKARLEDEVVAYLLQRLDPHSYYIPEEDLATMNEPLDGGFEGIGVQFNLRNDSIYVVNTIPGGPSEAAGLLPGDRIVEVDSVVIAGTGLNNRKVMGLLKGPEGSAVQVGVQRRGSSEVLRYQILRGAIPISSFDAIYLLDDSTIYVKLARFSKTTYEEFQERVYPLKTTNTKGFVLDLRGNGGGYLDAAVNLADEFLPDGVVITYTEGKSRPRRDYLATSDGAFEGVALSIIIDGYSASASEIMAGAIQDLQRGWIVGKRSYGKGLVQEQNEWNDGSATRLTVARYYTPNGRSIQRPYQSLSGSETNLPDTLIGGIDPDINVERDTTGVTWFFAELVHGAMLTEFAYHWRDRHYAWLSAVDEHEFSNVLSSDTLASGLRLYLDHRGVEINEKEWTRSIDRITLRIQALIARSLFGDQTYFRILNQTDPFVIQAMDQLRSAKRGSPALR